MATIKLADGRGELYQWDTGRKVVIDDETIKQVHYQNRFYGRTIDVDVSDGTAIIPDHLLQSFASLVVFAWSGSVEDGYTKIEKTFEIHKRNKPSDYVFTPVDQKTLDDLQKQIGDLADLTTDAKSNLVEAINEAVESGGGSPDAVLYTAQTLTDAQKKQARENIDATSSDFVINATLDDDNNCTVDKTYAQIQETVQANKKPVVHLEQGGTTVFMPLVASGGYFGFEGSILINPPISAQFVVSIQDNNEAVFDMSYGLGLGHDNALPQVRMSKDPREAMEIATKQYVDDHASSGTGMGITNAAVGQIAKITAVDESGVPTAWVPVDMPAGVPSVTADDTGKFLRVVNGAWAAAAINDANGASF